MFHGDMWKEHRVAELEGTPVQISLACGCTRVMTLGREWVFERFGPDATFADCERRMICRECKQRPVLTLRLPYGLSGGRDRRPMADRQPLPLWMPRLG